MGNSEQAAVKLDVRMYHIATPKDSVVAKASVTINDIFTVNNIRVVNSKNGPFLVMPQGKDAKGKCQDICFPVTEGLRKQLSDTIIGVYMAKYVAEREAELRKQLNDLGTYVEERKKAAPQKEKFRKKRLAREDILSTVKDEQAAVKFDVRAYLIDAPKGSVVALASVTINGMFIVRNIRVMKKGKYLFVEMPQGKDARGEYYRDICSPMTEELRKRLNDTILGAYTSELEAELRKQLNDLSAYAVGHENTTPQKEKQLTEDDIMSVVEDEDFEYQQELIKLEKDLAAGKYNGNWYASYKRDQENLKKKYDQQNKKDPVEPVSFWQSFLIGFFGAEILRGLKNDRK